MSEHHGTTVESVPPDDLTLTDEYQVIGDLDAETYQAITVSIETDGYDDANPIIADEEGTVLDGHHRLKASRTAGLDTVPVVRKTGLSDTEKREEAYAQNLRRRNLAAGAKRDLVKTYLAEEFDPDEQTQTEVANLLGVSTATVSRARSALDDETRVDTFSGENVTTESRADKRARVREYLEKHPDTSNRSVADDLGVSKTTVGRVRNTLDGEAETETEVETTDETGTGTDADAGSSESPGDSSPGGGTEPEPETNANGSDSESANTQANQSESSGKIRDMMNAVESGGDTDSEPDPESPTPAPSLPETKHRVFYVLDGAHTPLTVRQVISRVDGDEKDVRTALSGLTAQGPVESSPSGRQVWWLPESEVDAESRLKRLSNDLAEPITVGDRVYEDGDAHPLDTTDDDDTHGNGDP